MDGIPQAVIGILRSELTKGHVIIQPLVILLPFPGQLGNDAKIVEQWQRCSWIIIRAVSCIDMEGTRPSSKVVNCGDLGRS